jgi:hypothetical protein
MAVTKRILRQLLGVRLAKIELLEPSGGIAKAIFSVSTSGPRSEMRYFPYLAQAEMYFFDQVQAYGGGIDRRRGMPDLLSVRTGALRRQAGSF